MNSTRVLNLCYLRHILFISKASAFYINGLKRLSFSEHFEGRIRRNNGWVLQYISIRSIQKSTLSKLLGMNRQKASFPCLKFKIVKVLLSVFSYIDSFEIARELVECDKQNQIHFVDSIYTKCTLYNLFNNKTVLLWK